MKNWISIKEQKPEPSIRVLTLSDKEEIAIGRFSYETGLYDEDYVFWAENYDKYGSWFILDGVTHWQRLPETRSTFNGLNIDEGDEVVLLSGDVAYISEKVVYSTGEIFYVGKTYDGLPLAWDCMGRVTTGSVEHPYDINADIHKVEQGNEEV